MIKKLILQALEDKYNAQISEAEATVKIYLEQSVGIGEHPQHIDVAPTGISFYEGNMFPKKRGNSLYQRQVRIPDITLEGMYEELILHIQLMKDKFPGTDGRICRYCEKPWTYVNTGFKEKRNHPNFSVDRFNSDETYKKGNIVFCCTQCNSRKNSTTKKDWLKYVEIDKEINDSKN